MDLWTSFVLSLIVVLFIDLAWLNRKPRILRPNEAFAWSFFWVGLALAFNGLVYFVYEENFTGFAESLTGGEAALAFFTGFILEKSLSVDYLFIIALLFSFYRVPLRLQHRILTWAIVGAVALRGIVIIAGIGLLRSYWWMAYLFGALLIATAIKMLVIRHDNIKPELNPVVRLASRFLPTTTDFYEDRFFVRLRNQWYLTPLCLVLIQVQSFDLLFAFDSIPAILAITEEPFLVFAANVFALLGLRSLYFALANSMRRFRYVKSSLVFVLAYVGVKMVLSPHYPISPFVTLAVVTILLGVGFLASLVSGPIPEELAASPFVEMQELAAMTWKQGRRMVILVIGTTVLLFGVVMVFLPGPATLIIPLGLAILAQEFLWARRLLGRIKDGAQQLLGRNKEEK